MKPVTLAYRSDWNWSDLPPGRVRWRELTHIAHAFAEPKRTGFTFPEEDHGRGLVAAARANGVAALLAVGGEGSNRALSALCASDAGAQKAADQIVAFADRQGYSGVDVDWEHPESAADSQRLTRFVALLRERLPHPRLVTLAAPTSEYYGRWYDAGAMLPHLDWFAVMCYDFYGAWTKHAGYHAALYPSRTVTGGEEEAALLTGDAAIRYWRERRRLPAAKLLLGVPLYARGFRAAAWGARKTADTAPEEMPFRALAVRKDLLAARDDAAVAATWVSADGAVRYAGDDNETARRKGAWARERNLGGVFFWELSEDGDGHKMPSLVAAARAGLLGSTKL